MSILICFLAVIFGLAGGMGGFIYLNLPNTEELIVGEEVYYTYNDSTLSTTQLSGAEGELSVHFLELGNKYTGDCTYIKYGDVDILIDCGSKSSSISTVENYLRSYMGDDNIIDYCIVTHAHTDHFAGFATSAKVQSIFDLFDFGTIIDFGMATNKETDISSATGMMKNYITNREEAIERGKNLENPTQYYDASTNVKDNNKIYYIGESNEVELEILYNEYNAKGMSSSENNYSVCVLLKYDNKEFLFTGDLEELHSEGETKLLENNLSLQEIANNNEDFGVELYKAGHHGSKTSSSQDFIDAIRPQVVCVCCCAGSPEYTDTVVNQFPTQDFINVIAKHTTNVFVTTLCVDWDNDKFESMNGNIVIIALPNENLGVVCSNNDTVLKDTEWFKTYRTTPAEWQTS